MKILVFCISANQRNSCRSKKQKMVKWQKKALVKSIYKTSTHPSPWTCYHQFYFNLFLILFHHLCWFHFQPDLSLCEKHNNPFFVFLSHLSMAALKRAHWSIRGYSVHLLWRRPFKCSQESFSERLGGPFCLQMIWYICWTIQGALLWIFLPQLACKHVVSYPSR